MNEALQLGTRDGSLPMQQSPCTQAEVGMSSDCDSLSETSLWTTRSPPSSPTTSIGTARIRISTRKPALCSSPSSLSCSSLLSDLELSAQDRLEPSSEVAVRSSNPGLQTERLAAVFGSPLSLIATTEIALQPEDPLMQTSTAMHPRDFARTAPGDVAKQPWREVWPPVPGSPEYLRIASRRPDLLSFSFDARNHLLHQNRPWQDWRSPSDEQDLHNSTTIDKLESSSVRCHSQRNPETRQRGKVDKLIKERIRSASTIHASLNYLCSLPLYDVQRPYRLQLPPNTVSLPLTNVMTESYPVEIHDISGLEDKFKLDSSGFQFFDCPVSVGQWNDSYITGSYLPALLDWVVPLLGGSSGFVYSFNFRHHSSDSFVPVQRPHNMALDTSSTRTVVSSDPGDSEPDEDYSLRQFLSAPRHDDPFNTIASVKADPLGPCHWKRPLFRVHCDASENTHKQRLPMFLPDDADRLMKGRVRLISVWRALSSNVQDTPLALCDARTVDRDDFVPMDIVYPHFVDEVYEVRYNTNHRWFYKRGMGADDVAIFKLHDTHMKHTVCPHSAFVDTTVPEDTPPRASIEVKIMIFGGDTQDDGGGTL